MKNYSEVIPTSYGFITSYEVVGDYIYVYTPESKKGEPHIYPATKENIDYFDKRLGTQYELIVENQDVIEDTYIRRKIQNVWKAAGAFIGAIAVTAGGMLVFSTEAAIATMISGLVLSIVGGKLANNKIVNDFEEEMDIIRTYLASQEDIEVLNQKDDNITQYLSKKTTKRIQQQEENQTIEKIFNIDFMDKTSLKDLRKLLTRYAISKNLTQPQTFVAPSESQEQLSEVPKKTRKPNQR